MLSLVQVFVAPRTVAHQTPLHGIFQQEFWSGLLFLTPGDLPDLGMEPVSLASSAFFTNGRFSGRFFTTKVTWEAHVTLFHRIHYNL